MTIAELIIAKNNLPFIWKKKHGNSPEITTKSFINVLIHSDSTVEVSELLGIGEQTVNRSIVKQLRPIFGKLNGGNETWKYILLNSIEYKQCHTCTEIKPYSKFGNDKSTPDGKYHKCRYCRSFDNASLYQARKLRIPSWHAQEKTKIAEFYDNCPEGYHVDHIIPLQGANVSGLHTLNNLQYLPAKDNVLKGNSFDIMGDW